MLSILLPLAYKIVDDAISKIPDNEELGEKLIVILNNDDWLTKNNENYNICFLNGEKDSKNNIGHIEKIKIFINTLG